MRENSEYTQAIEQAETNMADVAERGAAAIGGDVLEFMDSFLNPEEIAESDLRVALTGELICAGQEKGLNNTAKAQP